jgi:hypothetical protein
MDKANFHEDFRVLWQFSVGKWEMEIGGPDILDGIENFFDKIVDMHTNHGYIAS